MMIFPFHLYLAPGDKIRAEFDREDLTLATNLPGYTIQMVFDETTYIR